MAGCGRRSLRIPPCVVYLVHVDVFQRAHPARVISAHRELEVAPIHEAELAPSDHVVLAAVLAAAAVRPLDAATRALVLVACVLPAKVFVEATGAGGTRALAPGLALSFSLLGSFLSFLSLSVLTPSSSRYCSFLSLCS